MSEEKREILTIDLSRRNFDDAVSSALQYKTEEQFFFVSLDNKKFFVTLPLSQTQFKFQIA